MRLFCFIWCILFLLSFDSIAQDAYSKSSEKEVDTKCYQLYKKGRQYNKDGNDSAAFLIKSALKEIGNVRVDSIKMLIYMEYGSIWIRAQKHDSAEFYLKKSLEIAARNKMMPYEIKLLNNLAITYQSRGRYNECVEYMYAAVKKAETLQDTTVVVFERINLTTILISLKEYKKAREQIRFLNTNYKRYIKAELEADYLICVAYCEVENKNTEKGISSLRKSEAILLTLKQTERNTLLLNKVYHELLYLFSQSCIEHTLKQHCEEAEKIGRKLIDSYTKNSSVKAEPITYILLAEMTFGTKDIDRSRSYLSEAKKICENNGLDRYLSRIYSLEAKTYKHLKKFDSAFYCLEKKIAIDSAQNIKQVKEKVNKLESDLKLQIKEKEINKAVYEKENAVRSRNYSLVLSSVALVLILLITYIFVQRRDKQKRNEFTIRLMRAQEDERKKISRELHDGIGQSLLFLRMEFKNSDYVLIDPIIEEVRGIAQNLYPLRSGTKTIDNAVYNLIDKIQSKSGIYMTADIEPIEIESDEVRIHLYRIIQEGFSNILKHSAAKNARVVLKTKDKSVLLTIKDDGKGFSNELGKFVKGQGINNMTERAKLFSGKLNISSSEFGTTIRLIFKL